MRAAGAEMRQNEVCAIYKERRERETDRERNSYKGGPRQQSQVGHNETRYEYIECHGRFSLSLSLFFSCSHGPMTLYRSFYRLWHSVSHGMVMVSPQKRSFNNLTVSPMYTITGVRTVSVWRERNQAAVSSPSKRAPKTMGSHNEQIL